MYLCTKPKIYRSINKQKSSEEEKSKQFDLQSQAICKYIKSYIT